MREKNAIVPLSSRRWITEHILWLVRDALIYYIAFRASFAENILLIQRFCESVIFFLTPIALFEHA